MSLLEHPEELEVLKCLDDQGGEGSLPLHLLAYADRLVDQGWLQDLTTFHSVDDQGNHVRRYLLWSGGRSVLAAERARPTEEPTGDSEWVTVQEAGEMGLDGRSPADDPIAKANRKKDPAVSNRFLYLRVDVERVIRQKREGKRG